MSLPLYFSSSSKVWDSIEWIFGIEGAGFSGWEIVADGSYRFDNRESFLQVSEALASSGLKVTVHAPYSDLNLASLNHSIWKESVRQIRICVERASDFTDRVTIHPGYLSPLGKLIPSKVWELQKEALREIGRSAEDAGVIACLENMGGPREVLGKLPSELAGMVDGIEGIGLTFDLGHAHMEGKVREFLSELGRADHLHIHDNHGQHDEHLALGDGTIDWEYAGSVIRNSYFGIVVVEGRDLSEGRRSATLFRSWFA